MELSTIPTFSPSRLDSNGTSLELHIIVLSLNEHAYVSHAPTDRIGDIHLIIHSLVIAHTLSLPLFLTNKWYTCYGGIFTLQLDLHYLATTS